MPYMYLVFLKDGVSPFLYLGLTVLILLFVLPNNSIIHMKAYNCNIVTQKKFRRLSAKEIKTDEYNGNYNTE